MQLASQGLVVAHDQRGDVELLDDVRHGEGLAAARHAEQHAPFLAIFQLRNQFFNCFWLVTGRIELESKPLDIGAQFLQCSAVQGFGEVKRVSLRQVNLEQRLVSERLKRAVVVPFVHHVIAPQVYSLQGR